VPREKKSKKLQQQFVFFSLGTESLLSLKTAFFLLRLFQRFR